MTPEESLIAAAAARDALAEAAEAHDQALTVRDAAVIAARRAGVPAADIAHEMGVSRQQIHRIIERNTGGSSVVEALRAEVMGEGTRYADQIEDDQIFIDGEVAALARKRGIELRAS